MDELIIKTRGNAPLTRDETTALALRIQTYWRGRGYDFRFTVEKHSTIKDGKRGMYRSGLPTIAPCFEIHSNTVNGFPPKIAIDGR